MSDSDDSHVHEVGMGINTKPNQFEPMKRIIETICNNLSDSAQSNTESDSLRFLVVTLIFLLFMLFNTILF